jgi:hypothetical protein
MQLVLPLRATIQNIHVLQILLNTINTDMNTLPKEITQKSTKPILKEYYYSALSLTFDPDDP